MALLDIFNNDIFSMVSLTLALEQLPYAPTKIGNMNLFRFEGISNTMVAIESRDAKLFLVLSAARGAQPTWPVRQARNIRAFSVNHLPINDTVMADDVLNVRAFGTEDQTESIATVINSRLEMLKRAMSLTFEWHRMGALRGIVLDADLTTVLNNWFDEFGITQEDIDFDFTSGAESLKLKCLDVIEFIEDALQGAPYDHIHAFVGRTWYRNMLMNDEIKEAFSDNESLEFRRVQQRTGFIFGDITWEPYRGKVDDTPWVADDEAIFFPVGVPDLFIHYGAPAPFMETVGTIGRDMYAKQERMEFDVGVKLHVDSSPLFICTRPKALVKGTDTTPLAFTAPTSMETNMETNEQNEFEPYQEQPQQIQ